MTVLWISLGAVLGALIRYGFQQLFATFSSLTMGTIVANLLGCFLIGYVYSIGDQVPQQIRVGILTGFLGSLTTMSSFALSIANLANGRQWASLLGVAILTLVGGIGLCFWGMKLGRLA